MRRLVAFVFVASCAPPESTATVAAPVTSVTPVSRPPASSSPSPPRKLRFVKGEGECSVVDDATSEVIGHATSKNTAAGGSNVECYDYLNGGKIIRFTNSRGIYAKDARPRAEGADTLRCGEGAFANDVKSCVRLDVTSQLFGGMEREADPAPFDIELCVVGGACKTLVTIPRGRNRLGMPGTPWLPRWWDAVYCSDDRVLIVADGTLSLFEVPSGKLVAKAPAPKATRLVRCSEGTVEASTSQAGESLVFTVDANGIRPSH